MRLTLSSSGGECYSAGMTAEQPSSFRQPLKLKVDDYLLLAKAGSLDQYERTELIDGTIIVVSPLHRPHARAVSLLLRRIADQLERLAPGVEALPDASVDMPPRSMPRPDIVLTDEPIGEGFVPVGSVKLLIEVSDSTLADDLGAKARLYAEQRIPEYWVVDLPGGELHQFWGPSESGFAQRRVTALGETIEAATMAGLSVETGGISDRQLD
jgi:Uma2 family endonuclease